MAISWTGEYGTAWTDARSWAPRQVPGGDDDVVVAKSGGGLVKLEGTRRCRTLKLDAGSAITGGTLRVAKQIRFVSGTLEDVDLVIHAGLTLLLEGPGQKVIRWGPQVLSDTQRWADRARRSITIPAAVT